jgi:hypothetical protein
MTVNWVTESDRRSVRDDSNFNNLVRDSVKLLTKYEQAFVFYPEHIADITKILNAKHISIRITNDDGVYLLERIRL